MARTSIWILPHATDLVSVSERVTESLWAKDCRIPTRSNSCLGSSVNRPAVHSSAKTAGGRARVRSAQGARQYWLIRTCIYRFLFVWWRSSLAQFAVFNPMALRLENLLRVLVSRLTHCAIHGRSQSPKCESFCFPLWDQTFLGLRERGY